MTAVSNSRTQKEFIDARCKERGLTNLAVVTADVVEYQAKGTFDRVMSVEMFEHMKNYQVGLWDEGFKAQGVHSVVEMHVVVGKGMLLISDRYSEAMCTMFSSPSLGAILIEGL